MIKINENILAKILRAGLYAVIFLLPLVVTPWTIYPFIFGKTIFFQSAIELLVAIFIVLIIIAPKYRPRFDAFTIIVLSYFGVMIIASLLGVDFLRSFWGTEERGMGLFTQLHFAAFFLMLRALLNEEKYQDRAFIVAVISGLLVSAAALLRLKGILLFGVDTGFRLSGTLANPLFFASILVFYLFFSLYLATKQKSLQLKIVYFIFSLIFFLMILTTQARGALIASLGGISFFFIISAIKTGNKWIKIAILIFFVSLVSLSLAAWTHPDSTIWKKVPVVRRLLSLKDTTASTRVLAWKVALRAFQEKPILGWGNDNFTIAFNQYYDPLLLQYSYGETWWDRPHNIVLEIMVHFGIVGLISYLSIFFYAGYWLLRQKTASARILAAGLLAYFVQNLFVFDSPSSLMLFMVFLSGIGKKLEVIPTAVRTAFNSQLSTSRLKAAMIVSPVLLLATGIMVYKLNWQPMAASAAMLQASVYASDYSPVDSIPLFRAALQFPTPYKGETRSQLTQMITTILANQAIPQEKFKEVFDFAEQEIKLNIKLHPRQAHSYFRLGRLYTEALYYDVKFAKDAEEAFGKALELSPLRQQFHFGLAKLYADQGQYEKALEIYRQAIAIAPIIGEAHWFYAVLLQEAGDAVGAEKELIQAGNLGHVPPRYEERMLMARLMAKEKNYLRAADYLKYASQMEEADASTFAQLAVAYKAAGYKENARVAAEEAAKMDPAYAAEAEIFLKTLD